MQTDFERMFQRGDNHYLQAPEILVFKHQVHVLAIRLRIYKSLRDREVEIFQSVADCLVAEFPDSASQTIERALRHWIATLRYGAMAVLLNNPEYFQHRILEWLTESVAAFELEAIEQRLYHLLREQLVNSFSAEEFHLLEPFLEQAHSSLFKSAENRPTERAMIGESA